MADHRRNKFERRMKSYRDHIKKKEQDSIEGDVEEKKQMTEEDKKRFIEMIKKLKKNK